jgi:hypothetical protein
MKQNEASGRFSRPLRVPSLHEAHESGTQLGLMVLGAIMAMALLSGCASAHLQGDSDPWKYNPTTGYPAVGGPRWIDS